MVSGIARSVSPPSTDSSHLPAPSARPIYWILFKLLLFNSEWFGSKVTTSWNTSNRYNVERHMQGEQETDLCERQPSLRKLKSDSVLFDFASLVVAVPTHVGNWPSDFRTGRSVLD